MLKNLILRKLDGVERELGESVDYLRHIVRHSVGAFLKFTKIMPLNNYRKVLPPDAWHVARIVAAREVDCGPCVQIEINLARKAGIDPAVLRAVIDENPDALPQPLADTYRFIKSVVDHVSHGEADTLRERVRGHYGETGLIEMALAVAVTRMFPTTKKVLGFATACSDTTLRT